MLFNNFFGYQDEGYVFKIFGFAHFIPIIIMFILIFFLFYYRKKIRLWKYEALFRHFFGALMILNQMAYTYNNIYITSLLYKDEAIGAFPFPYASVTKDLPLSLCGISMILTGFLFFNKSKRLFAILYFWVICGATLAIIFPSAIANNTYGHFGPDKFRYYQFWIGHIGIIMIIAYMIIVWEYKIKLKSLIYSFIWLIIFGASTLIVNLILDANYLFIMNPKDTGLNFLPNYPWSIPSFILLGFIFYLIIFLPWHFIEKRKTAKS
jgi:hypothetical integral membrane protein (TIGR02206 family)